jgi:hypothetical protein
LKAATDAEISVKRDGDLRYVTAEKVRDGEDGEVLLTFKLDSVDLGPMIDYDPEADPVERCTSCVLAPSQTQAELKPRVRLADTDHIALRTLQDLCAKSDDHTSATSIHPGGLARVTVDAWREQFRIARGVPRDDAKALDASRKAFQRAVDRLTTHRLAGLYESRAWLW